MRVGSLFAGIGGFDLAAEALGWSTRWFVEWDASCQFWLAQHFPGVPIYGDIATVDFTQVERVDVLCGGFPCQPVSQAGRRRAQADERWLWPDFARAIRELRPRYVAIENTPGLLTSGLTSDGGVYEVDECGLDDRTARAFRRAMGDVLGGLAALGYDAEWNMLSAADLGAPHERKRIWIVAYPDSEVRSTDGGASDAGTARRDDAEGRGARVGDTESLDGRSEQSARGEGSGRAGPRGTDARLGNTEGGGWRARAGEPVRRTERGCDDLGDAISGRQSGDDGRGTSEVAPNGRAELDDTTSGRRETGGAGDREARRLGERLDALRRDAYVGDTDRTGFVQRGGAESVRAALGPAQRRGREVRDWRDAVPLRGGDGSVRLVPRDALDETATTPPELSGWPLADGLPGSVARLRAVGNAVIPKWALAGPFARISALEAERAAPSTGD